MAVGISEVKVGIILPSIIFEVSVLDWGVVAREGSLESCISCMCLTHTTGTFFCSVLVYLWVEVDTTTLLESPSVSDLKASPITHSL